MNLSDFSLMGEDDGSYKIGHPKGRTLSISKKGLSDKSHQMISKLKKHQNYAEGTPDAPIDIDRLLSSNEPQPNSTPVSEEPDFTPPPVAPKMTAAAEQQATTPAEEEEESSPQAASVPAPKMDQGPDLDKALTNAIGAEQGGVQAQKQAGKQEQQALQTEANQLQDLTTPEDKFNGYQDKDAQLEKAVQDHKIDPDRYWNNKSTGSKIAAIIGVALGGFGSGLTGQPNAALGMLKDAAQKDIAAQMNDQSKNMNLWKMNREALGSDIGATLATENQYNSIAQAKLKSAAAGALGPQAQANAAQTILGLQQARVQNNRYLAAMQWSKTPGVSAQDPAQIVGQLVPKEQQAKALDEVGKLKQAVQLKKDFIQSYNDLNNKILGGILDPQDRASATGAYAGIIAKLGEGRFNMEEAKQQADALLPARFEGSDTRKNKMARINNFFDGLVQAPTLEGNFINPKKFSSTNLNSVNQSYLPGTVVSVKGKQYKVGNDGDSLSPI